MRRSASLLVLLLALASTALAQRPNVVLIVSDDQAWDDFGFMGHELAATPRIDRLAAGSAVFRRGYGIAPLCRPSLATLATGLWPHQHGIVGNDPAPGVSKARLQQRILQVATVPRLLADAGYRCLQTGKWWEGPATAGGFTHGMTHGDPRRGGRHGDEGLKIGREGLAPIAGFLDDAVAAEDPFFVWYAPFLPHTPHTPPQRLLDKYAGRAAHPAEAKYLAMVEWFDETVGGVLDLLEERGLTDDTLVLFCIDNGWITLKNGRGDFARSKRSPYEAGIRTPILARWPGTIPVGDRPEVVSTLDIAPTILTACGVTPPAPLPGRDLAAVAAGDGGPDRPAFGTAFTHDVMADDDPNASAQFDYGIVGRHKAIVARSSSIAPEVYDVVADPHEREPLPLDTPEARAAIDAVLAWRASWNTPEPDRRPNVLFVLTDDQRYDQVGFAGHPVLQTPNMDRLAAEGTRFTQALVTTSICAASRASILTGTWRGTHGYTFGTPPLSRTLATWPGELRRHGWRTGFVGKLGVKLEARPQELFDWFRQKDGSRYPAPDAPDTKRHLTDEIADEAIAFLDASATEGRPFCLSVSFRAPHADDGDPRQYVWPRDLDGLYDDADVPLAPLEAPEHFAALPELLQGSLGRERFFWRFDTPEKRAAMIRGYWRMITGIDRAVGRILAKLDAIGAADDTLVVFTSDNGYFLGERGLAGKWLIYEDSIRVPLVVRMPRDARPPAGSIDTPALNVDLGPTILAACGVPVPDSMQGRDLLPLVRGERVAWRDDVFYEHRFDHAKIPEHEGVRTPRWTYVRYVDVAPPLEMLFDRAADPLQTRDLAADADHADQLLRLRRRTDELRALRVR